MEVIQKVAVEKLNIKVVGSAAKAIEGDEKIDEGAVMSGNPRHRPMRL